MRHPRNLKRRQREKTAAETDETLVRYSISGKMTSALVVYSAVFMRYSMAVTPANYLLFGPYHLIPGQLLPLPPKLRRSRGQLSDNERNTGCHFVNEISQLTQGYRYLQYWQYVLLLPLCSHLPSPSSPHAPQHPSPALSRLVARSPARRLSCIA